VPGPVGRLHGVRFDGEGPDVLLVHPLNTSGRIWTRVAARLRRRALLPDLRGHGASTARGPYALNDFAADLVAVLDAFEVEQADVGGGSIGGALAVVLAAREPARIRSIAAFGSGLTAEGADPETLAELRTRPVDDFFRTIAAEALAPGAAPELIEELVGLASEGRDEKTVAAVIEEGFAWDVRTEAAAVRCRALVVTGEEDAAFPPGAGEELARALRTEPVVLAGVGHLPMLEVPEQTALLLERHLA
jgi:3-oxoadipate enol-lactonase